MKSKSFFSKIKIRKKAIMSKNVLSAYLPDIKHKTLF